jgi:DNA invertase Pin-like site-specific DNA recombinase
MNNNKKVAVYCRVAQQDDEAITLQREKVLHFAKEQGYSDISVYADNGASGLDFNRKAFIDMNADIAAGKINTVIVQSINRIGRDFIKTQRWIDGIRSKGIIVAAMDNSCDFSFVPFIENIQNFIAESKQMKRKSSRKSAI